MMENIAPAVLNGGFSTLLAMSLLVTAKSHVATSFFKIFFMICVFGLFHGLILLPTVLCMVGPSDEDIMRQSCHQMEYSILFFEIGFLKRTEFELHRKGSIPLSTLTVQTIQIICDNSVIRQNSKRKHRDTPDHGTSNGTKSSDQKEREQNLENEQSELKVPLNREETELSLSSDAVIRGENLSRLKESPMV